MAHRVPAASTPYFTNYMPGLILSTAFPSQQVQSSLTPMVSGVFLASEKRKGCSIYQVLYLR
jgi:hypothetical protein